MNAEMIQRLDAVINMARMDLNSATKDMAREFESIANYATKAAEECTQGFRTHYGEQIESRLERIRDARIRQAKAAEVLRTLGYVKNNEVEVTID